MLIRGSAHALRAGAIIFGLCGQSAAAQSLTAEAVKKAAVIDVPFVLGDIDTVESAQTLWVKGDAPANPLLARFSVRPLQAAALGAARPGGEAPVLWRAFPGGGITVLRSDVLDLSAAPRYFCGAPANPRALSCFIDVDANGTFDQSADAIAERGSKPYHVTVIKAARPLTAPLPYRVIADDLRPAVTIELRNCAKDYDRPRYVALSTSDRNVPVTPTGFAWHAKDSSFAYCRRGSKLVSVAGQTVSPPANGFLAQMGPLAFTVGSKQNPQIKLIGPAEPLALYRLEGASLVNMSVGHTPSQAQLLALKQFPFPVMMTDQGAVIRAGDVAAGGEVAAIPFHHAYRGKLTQDVSIATLFGKRSVPAGTTVYGFPSQGRISRTVNGIPDMQAVGDDDYRKIDLELTWCAPVRDAEPKREKPNALGRGGWSAACIPHSMFGNHTIIAGMQPAFAISGVSYSTETSSNDGPPPIERADESGFGKPLQLKYVFEGRDGEFISLSEQILFGDELTSSKPSKLYAPAGSVLAELAGAPVELTLTSAGLSVKPLGSPVAGSNPLLRWDQRAFMVQQLQKMGLKLAEPEADADGPSGVGSTD